MDFTTANLVAACLLVGLIGCEDARASVVRSSVSEPSIVPQPSMLMANMVPARVRKPQLAPKSSPCPEAMVLVEGDYCPKVRHTCKRYLDPPGRYENFRCAEYAPARCLSTSRVAMRFCIDVDEYSAPGTALPENFRSYSHAVRLCAEQGKRVCGESEWNFACEGEAMRPYPYGFERDSSACNADHAEIVGEDGKLKDMRAPADAYPRCTSPFGVRNLTGNLEEFVTIDGSHPPRPAMKGAYWQPSRNHCRAAQTAHDRYYHGMETGFRCCAEPFPDVKSTDASGGAILTD